MRTARILAVAAIALALPLTVAAQEPDEQPPQPHHPGTMMPRHPGMMQPGQRMQGRGWMGQGWAMMGAGMGAMAEAGPGMLLRLRESLKLTADQVDRLEGLQEQTQKAVGSALESARTARQQAVATMESETPDLTAHEKALREAASHMVDAAQAMARARVQAEQVLTATQKQTLETIEAALREMHQGRGMQPGMQGQHPRVPNRPAPQGGDR